MQYVEYCKVCRKPLLENASIRSKGTMKRGNICGQQKERKEEN